MGHTNCNFYINHQLSIFIFKNNYFVFHNKKKGKFIIIRIPISKKTIKLAQTNIIFKMNFFLKICDNNASIWRFYLFVCLIIFGLGCVYSAPVLPEFQV